MQEWQHFLYKAQQGDLSAFDVLVQQFRDMAVAYAYSILGDFQLGEDAAQEAFVQAYKDLKTLRSPLAFPSWLRRIVFKYCDRITRKKRVETVPMEMVTAPAQNRETPPEMVQSNETNHTILQSINALPENERTVTTLFYMNGYSMSEVGNFLEVPISTVKSRLHSARKKLRERMVPMVRETLKHHAPGKKFNERLREILGQVPVVSYQLHQLPGKDGLRRCPESFPFPSCLRACLEYLGHDMGYKKINVHGRDWRLDSTYVYLMGTTGSSFKLTWKPGWHLDNPLISHMSADPFEPFKRGLASVGYEYEIIHKEAGRDNESYFRKRIIESISEFGRPVIANGVVGPPVDCLITGFDQGGEVLIGWSFFQKAKEFNVDVEFEANGCFRKPNWFNDTHRLIILGEKKQAPQLENVYRESLHRALTVIRTPKVNDRHNGLAAYQAWSEAIRQDNEFIGKKVKELVHRYHVHQDAVGSIAEGRWYGFQFLKKVIEDITVPGSLSEAAQCYDDQHSLMWKVWGLVGGPGASSKKAKLFADAEIREKTARLILEAREKEQKAADIIEQTLKEWY
ncbi:MAG: RNA polymerase sigma factor [Candidatus Aminicenantes bacterium]|nr:MAG: RNA polymerase sigma factor [Candidatus Aminicenantes bacterium]